MNEEREALIARTLQISPETWRAVCKDYRERLASPSPAETPDEEIARCLDALARAYSVHSPHATAAPADAPPRACVACGAEAVRPFIVRLPGPLTYGRCDSCGQGALLNTDGEAAARARHSGDAYYRRREDQGTGYHAYADEAVYREANGARLIARLHAVPDVRVQTLLEVGCGFGFTRIAAERAGIRTGGVDVNAHACDESRRRGLAAFHGTLDEALASPASGIAAGQWDAVLYQFVLEHIVDQEQELALAHRALRPHGCLVLLIPSMEAAEIAAFGASYRSFRADHLHLPTRASLQIALPRAGFEIALCETSCNVHLLRGLLSDPALDRIYATGRGPDLFVVAKRSP